MMINRQKRFQSFMAVENGLPGFQKETIHLRRPREKKDMRDSGSCQEFVDCVADCFRGF